MLFVKKRSNEELVPSSFYRYNVLLGVRDKDDCSAAYQGVLGWEMRDGNKFRQKTIGY